MKHVVVLTDNDLLALMRGTVIHRVKKDGTTIILTDKENYEKFYKED